jgi:hypothetical protein
VISQSRTSYRSVVTVAPEAADVAICRAARAFSLATIASRLSQMVTISPLRASRSTSQ